MVKYNGDIESARKNKFQATRFRMKLAEADQAKSNQAIGGIPSTKNKTNTIGIAKAKEAQVKKAAGNLLATHFP
jgi:hypothetical protein